MEHTNLITWYGIVNSENILDNGLNIVPQE